MTPLAGVELESLVSEPDALTTRPSKATSDAASQLGANASNEWLSLFHI